MNYLIIIDFALFIAYNSQAMRGAESFVGERFAGNQMHEIIGRGSTASVYRATHIDTDRPVAVKVFKSNVEYPDVEEEARVQSRLKGHDHILPYRYHGFFRDHPFIEMMHANKGSLDDVIRTGGKLATDTVVRHVLAAADATQYAHEEEKTVHGDLKLRNLLLHQEQGAEEDQLFVSDWGIAGKAHGPDSIGRTRHFPRGTTAYMAPEQALGDVLRQSDIYSLGGVVTFELATGRKPFVENDSLGYVRAHRDDAPPTFEAILGSGNMTPMHEAIEPAVQRALQKDPRNRQPSMGDYAEQLRTDVDKVQGKQKKEVTVIDLGDKTKQPPAEQKQGEETTHSLLSDQLATIQAQMAELLARETDTSGVEAKLDTILDRLPERPKAAQEPVDEMITMHDKDNHVDKETSGVVIVEENQTVDTLKVEQEALRGKLYEINSRLAEQEDDPILEAELRNPDIQRAKEILGSDFIGVEGIRKMEEKLREQGVYAEFLFDQLPEFPFNEQDLQHARKTGEVLILRPESIIIGNRESTITTRVLQEQLRVTFSGTQDGYPEQVRNDSFELVSKSYPEAWSYTRDEYLDSLTSEWAFFSKTAIPNGAIQMDKTIEECKRGLSRKGARANQVRNRNIAETIWDTIMYNDVVNENKYAEQVLVVSSPQSPHLTKMRIHYDKDGRLLLTSHTFTRVESGSIEYLSSTDVVLTR